MGGRRGARLLLQRDRVLPLQLPVDFQQPLVQAPQLRAAAQGRDGHRRREWAGAAARSGAWRGLRGARAVSRGGDGVTAHVVEPLAQLRVLAPDVSDSLHSAVHLLRASRGGAQPLHSSGDDGRSDMCPQYHSRAAAAAAVVERRAAARSPLHARRRRGDGGTALRAHHQLLRTQRRLGAVIRVAGRLHGARHALHACRRPRARFVPPNVSPHLPGANSSARPPASRPGLCLRTLGRRRTRCAPRCRRSAARRAPSGSVSRAEAAPRARSWSARALPPRRAASASPKPLILVVSNQDRFRARYALRTARYAARAATAQRAMRSPGRARCASRAGGAGQPDRDQHGVPAGRARG